MLTESFWEHYKNDEVTPQIKHWADLWKERIERFPESRFGLKLSSPRLLLTDILDEVQFNGLKNEKLKAHFSGKIKEWKRIPSLLDSELRTVIDLLNSAILSDKAPYVTQLCEQGLEQLKGSSYFKYLMDLLRPILTRQAPLGFADYEKLESVSRLLIIEFMMNGYALKTCADFPRRIFDGYEFDGTMLTTSFPTKCSAKDYQRENAMDFAAYGKARAMEMDALTVVDRIDALIRLYEQPEESFDFIFPLKGVKGVDVLKVGDVTVYSPESKKFYQDKVGSLRELEFFNRKPPFVYANAIVGLKSKDFDFSKEKALSAVESALDVLRFYSHEDGQPSVDRGAFLVLHKDGQIASMGSTTPKETMPHWIWEDAIDISASWKAKEEDSFNEAANLIVKTNKELTGASRQVASAMHWHRKARQESHLEEQLLDHWVGLEKLFSDAESRFDHDKFSAIVSLLPSVYVRRVIYSVGWDTFHYLRELLGTISRGHRVLNLSDGVIAEAGLKHVEGQTIHIQDFISCLGKISAEVDRKIIREKVELTAQYFSDPSFASEYLAGMLKEVETDLLLIYRYRNKIVHDAHYDDRLLPYYLAKAEQYCGNFLGYMIARMKEGDGTIYEWATAEKAKMARVIHLLGSGEKLDLMKVLG